jgi:methyl coenzyme M reductase gamma subunit
MYQHGQGVKQDDAKAVAWYRLAADQGSVSGKNVHALKEELEERCSGCWESANVAVSDPAIEVVRRRVRMRDLRAQITGLETDALAQENSADELASIGKGGKGKKNDAIAKVMDAVGTVAAEKPRLDAAESREEAARLHEELARLESLEQSTSNVPVP